MTKDDFIRIGLMFELLETVSKETPRHEIVEHLKFALDYPNPKKPLKEIEWDNDDDFDHHNSNLSDRGKRYDDTKG